MSTYLLAFVAAPLEELGEPSLTERSGVEVRVWRWPGREHAAAADIQRFAARALDELESMLGMGMGVPKLDLVPVAQFMGEAMENWGLVTFRAGAFGGVEGDSLWASRELVVHELAHMWFGNLVTAEWWSDLWCHEGTATFLSAWVLRRIGPRGDRKGRRLAWPRFVQFAFAEAADADSVPSTRAIVPEALSALADVEAMFDAVTYSKAAMLLRSLKLVLGAKQLLNTLRAVLRRHALSSISTNQLLEFLPRQCREYMGHWLRTPGFPLLTHAPDGSLYQLRAGLADNVEQHWPLVVRAEAGGFHILSGRRLRQVPIHNILNGAPTFALIHPPSLLTRGLDDPSSSAVLVASLRHGMQVGCKDAVRVARSRSRGASTDTKALLQELLEEGNTPGPAHRGMDLRHAKHWVEQRGDKGWRKVGAEGSARAFAWAVSTVPPAFLFDLGSKQPADPVARDARFLRAYGCLLGRCGAQAVQKAAMKFMYTTCPGTLPAWTRFVERHDCQPLRVALELLRRKAVLVETKQAA